MLSYVFTSFLLVITAFATTPEGDALLMKCQSIRNSIANQRGFLEGDEETVKKLLDELVAWNDANDDYRLLVEAIQLSMWVNDNEKCNALFARLIDLRPNDTGVAVAWAQYQLQSSGDDSEAVYKEILAKFPNTPEIVGMWASFLEDKNDYSQAIAAMETLQMGSLDDPKIATTYARLLYADNRFEESLNALDTIDPAQVTNTSALSATINKLQSDSTIALEKWTSETSIREVEEMADDLPLLIMHTSKGTIGIEMYEDHAPNTVANFISLAEKGYYDGIKFHRVIPKFMAQGGDPNTRDGATGNPGQGGPGYTIKDEHTNPDRRNHFAGSLSMAKTAAPNTAGSQFFLTHLPTPHLDGRHTVFGRVTDGLDIARSLNKDDEIITVVVVRKRDHEYSPETIGEKTATPKLTPSLKPTSTSK
jgi:cyclophilin family peptidyl-prolyl cis-trans isomerase